MKTCLICYHANIKVIYKPEWIEQFKQSILNQTFKDFVIYEICYNGGEDRIFENSIYESKKLPTFIHAMNYLIEKCLDDGADVISNTNCDDNYSINWLKIQLPFIKYFNFDIVSCNFTLIQNDKPVHYHFFDKLNIKNELERNNNIVAHPGVMYSRKFLENNKYIPEEIPIEDLLLWKRTIDNYKFKIVEQNLLWHRIHDNSVCKSTNR